jgi:hypothetical protein
MAFVYCILITYLSIEEGKEEVKFTCKATNAPESADSAESADEEELQAEDRGISIIPAIEIRDKIKYKVETGKKGVEVEVDYKQEFEEVDGEAEGETKTSFKIVFERIVEYIKSMDMSNSTSVEDQAYDWNTDEIVQEVMLEDWAEMSMVVTDGVVSHFYASTEDQMVAFNFSISRADQGEKLTANTMKIDMHIVGFPWTRSDTFLALISTVSSEMEVDVKHDKEASVLVPEDDVQIPFASEVDTIGFVPFGSYKWDGSAEAVESDAPGAMSDLQLQPIAVDKSVNPYEGFITLGKPSKTVQVIATSPLEYGNETTQVIAYSFVGSAAQNASYIYWDPEAGIGYEATDDAEFVMGENGAPMTDFSAAFSTGSGFVAGLVIAVLANLFAVAA